MSNSEHASRPAPDADLRNSIPTYALVGGYLGELLVNEINSSRLPAQILSAYTSADAILQEFRVQYSGYVRQCSPFDRYWESESALCYWQSMSRHFDAQVLAYIAIKLYSIVPNSMAEEQTVSNFTKLNSSDRGRQKTSTLVFMTQIKQHQQRLRKVGPCS